MKAIGYARVSTAEQARNGISLEVQQEKVEAMAKVQGAELAEIIVEDASAKTLRRPGMERVLAMVRARQVDAVIIYKLDRLTRSVRDLGRLLELFDKAGVALVSVSESLDTGTAAGRLVLNVMGAVAQWEREAIAERTREALQAKKSKGERVGTVPYGYQLSADGVHMKQESREQRTLRTIRKLREAGQSLRTIAAELNRRGLRTRRGSAWRFQYVANLIAA